MREATIFRDTSIESGSLDSVLEINKGRADVLKSKGFTDVEFDIRSKVKTIRSATDGEVQLWEVKVEAWMGSDE